MQFADDCRSHALVLIEIANESPKFKEQSPGPREGYEAHADNGAHPCFTWRDLFDNGELLWRIDGPQRHDKPANPL